MNNESYASSYSVAQAGADERALFIRRTYMHVALAILAFVGLSALFWRIPAVVSLSAGLLGKPIILLVAGMGVSWLANSMAYSQTSRAGQYLGRGRYTLLVAFIFVPVMMMAHYQFPNEGILEKSAYMTLALFAGLTAISFTTKKDFNFLGPILTLGFFIALGLIACGMIFGFSLGIWFSFGMVALCAGSILFTTSNMIRHFPSDMYVGAALSLFAGIAMMFWYILQIFMSRD